ncbi:hypothetical protein [Bacillus massiliglaciei]|nr:hypothetical protein [Bacillus massiliglaciei]
MKWNDQSAPNNHHLPEDMNHQAEAAPEGKMDPEQLQERKVEKDVRRQNF